ncbi:PilZ domain-containing protein [uncultured Gilvimarinus sp.]|mgnify:CR=1 FL=1|uniref:PilZ domain-containing protein n=1 Tax=uncultured Gilvimarinus sp. TaxID=1689143 RepID=UPI0030EDA425|tara:strand:- start:1913 stop:3067 length:1155 start_codon:yes stop_codon:yes gene_type:complete
MNTIAHPSQKPQVSPKIVHEAIDERQNVRARFPAKVILIGSGSVIECQVHDLSLGGIGVLSDEPVFEGQLFKAQLIIGMANATLNLDADIKVVKKRGEIIGLSFLDLSPTKRDIIRHVMVSYLAGDIVEVDGLLTVMQRENYIKKRKAKVDNTRNWKARTKAIIGTSVYFLVGLAIMAFLVYKLYLYFFQVQTSQAFVDSNSYRISMPENGYVTYMLPAGTTSVAKGDPIATVSSQLAASFTTPADIQALSNLSEAEVSTLLGRSLIETVVSSPCDCDVVYQGGVDDRYAYEGEELVHLIPRSEPLFVRASVPYQSAQSVEKSSHVSIRVYGEPDPYQGEIVSTRYNTEDKSLDLVLKTERAIAMTDYMKPATVDIYRDLPFRR